MQLNRPHGADALARPTAREREYLLLLCRCPEPTLDEIAEHMGLSAKTAEKHRYKLMRKLGAHTTLELFMQAVRLGLVRCCCQRHAQATARGNDLTSPPQSD
ncbi:MAG TPA: helix-turn-helix transcriptional regulator [Flavobacteriales bacterium]|nr:helix-turn-helix transcriptional regulator [Flavobacteriales bacterium]